MHKSFRSHLKYLRILPLVLALLPLASMAHAQDSKRGETLSYDRSSAVIFAYQRIGEDLYPATNLGIAQFQDHVQELIENDYHIAPLADIVAALQTGSKLPDKTVAITFNGAYQSAYKNAMPLLVEKNIPFTVFFSADQAEGKNPEYMGWADLKKLRRYNQVDLGVHPARYTRLTESAPDEIRRQVNNALTRYRQEFKATPQFFAYPFGEYTRQFREIVQSAGFTAAFGQQSGGAYNGSDLFALPRFSMTESYGDEARFRMAALALPLPVSDVAPDNPHITQNNPPTLGFTLDESLVDKIPQLSCYISEQGKPAMQVIGKNRIELRVTEPFQNERVRLNCTMPGPAAQAGEEQRWRWFGLLLSVDQPGDGPEDLEADPQSGPYPN